MADGDTPLPAGPQTIEERLASVTAEPETDTREEEEAHAGEAGEAEPETKAEAEGDTPDDEAETETTEAPDAEEGEGPQVLTLDEYGDVFVEVNGERTTLADLAKGTLRQSDYTRKTQELAEERKAIAAEKARIADLERQARIALAKAEGDEPEPDWEKVFSDDPIDGPRQKLIWDRKQAQKAQARQALEQEQLQQMAAFRQHTERLALEKVPEWQKAEAYAATEPSRKATALEAGFSEQEYNSAVDLRMAVLLEWARIGREKVKAGAAVDKKVARAPVVMKPGKQVTKAEAKASEAQATKRKLARPHTVEDRLKALGLS